MGRKKKMKGIITVGDEDRISSLPESLIHHILSFLLMRDVIRTCLLSKRWRNIWKSTPVLNFGFLWFIDHPFIDQTLIYYEGQKIQKFQLNSEGWNGADRLESWLRFAVTRGVEELDMASGDDTMLPRHLLEGLELRVLRWRLLHWTPPPFRFPSLTELHLSHFSSTDLDTSACPLLEVLILEYPSKSLKIYAPNLKLRCLKIKECYFIYGMDSNLTVYAPNLSYIEFKGSVRRFYEFKDISSVKIANFESWEHIFESTTKAGELDFVTEMTKYGVAQLLVELLRNFTHAKSFKLCQTVIQILAYGETIGLEIPSMSATCLELRTKLYKTFLVGIASLLRGFRCIERLIINIKYSALPDDMVFQVHDIDVAKAWESIEHALSVELAVNTISIRNYPGFHCNWPTRRRAPNIEKLLEYCHVEIKLVGLLLKSCKKLNKMDISIMKPPFQPLKLTLLYDLTKMLLVFPRASANAEVYFS